MILDEAHCIRNQRTLASRVCCSLKAEHRWCVSGTIIQNSLDDVFGIMKFLKHEPWCFPSFWKSAITVPAKAKITDDELDPKLDEENLQKALGRVRRVLGPLMLRRTKDSVSKDGEPILKLPPVERKTVFVKMSETEREFYNAVLARSMQVFDGFVEAGIASKAYIQILSMLTRLRQVCDHISLTVKSHIDDEEWMASVAKDSPEDDDTDIKEPANSSDSDGLGKQFLEGLLKKFYDRQQSPRKDLKRSAEESDLPPKQKKMDYVSKIALAVTKAVQDNCSHIEEECAICLEHPKIDDAVLTPCAHIFCRDCLLQTLRAQATGNYDTIAKPTLTGTSLLKCPDGKCPTCQGKVKAKNIIAMSKSRRNGGEAITSTYLTKPSAVPAIKQEVRETQEGNPFAMARQILENAVSGTESSKLNAVINELMLVWTQDPGSKVLIFSHFLGFLDLLGNQLHNDGITFFRLDGSLNLKERMNVLEQFRSDQQHGSDNDSASSSVKKGTVLLMSMGAGGEGLNITSASSCFIIEPWLVSINVFSPEISNAFSHMSCNFLFSGGTARRKINV